MPDPRALIEVFYQLDYTHEEIEYLLDKIYNARILSDEQYEMLESLGFGKKLALSDHTHDVIESLREKVSLLSSLTHWDQHFLHNEVPGLKEDVANNKANLSAIETKIKGLEEQSMSSTEMIQTISSKVNENAELVEQSKLDLENKVDKEEGKVLSSNDFENKFVTVLTEIIGDEGNRKAIDYIKNIILLSILAEEEENGNQTIGSALSNKSDVGHDHEGVYYEISDEMGLSANDFSNEYKEILDEVMPSGSAAGFVENHLVTSSYLSSKFDEKAPVGHDHIAAYDERYVLQDGDKILSDCNYEAKEKTYVQSMLTNGPVIVNDLLISNKATEGMMLNIEFDKKVDKEEGFTLISESDVEKLNDISLIEESDIDSAISDIFK